MTKQKAVKLLCDSVPLTLAVNNGEIKLELKLAWTMWGAMRAESRLRKEGININILQDLKGFWQEMDCTKLAVGVWAMSFQEHPEYRDEEGLETIASFLVSENQADAVLALKEAFLLSLSEENRETIKRAEAEAASRSVEEAAPAADPTPAPVQA